MIASEVPTSKLLVSAGVRSFFVMLAASCVLTLIATQVPQSPIAKMLYIMSINNNNTQVYGTAYYHSLEPSAEFLDAFIVTPCALLCGGLFFGWWSKKRGADGIVQGSFWAGLIQSLLILFAGRLFVRIAEITSVGTRTPSVSKFFNLATELTTLEQIVLWIAVFVLGAWLVSLRTRARDGATTKNISQARGVGRNFQPGK